MPAHPELRLVEYIAAHTRLDTAFPASAVINLAAPSPFDDPTIPRWSLRAADFTAVSALRLDTTAFGAPGRLCQSGSTSDRTLTLAGGAFTLQGTEVNR